MRSAFSITLDVWRAIFLREALDRLFGMRAAWFWLLIEPIFHIGFIAVVWSLIRRHVASGTDIAVWITIGMLAFFLFPFLIVFKISVSWPTAQPVLSSTKNTDVSVTV